MNYLHFNVWWSILIFVLIGCREINPHSFTFGIGKKYEIVRCNSSGDFLLLQKTWGTIQVILDFKETAFEFYIQDVSSVPSVDPLYYSNFKNTTYEPFFSLKKDKNNPDELIGTIVKKSTLLQPAVYWKESFFLLGYFNPAFVDWNNETLVAWRR